MEGVMKYKDEPAALSFANSCFRQVGDIFRDKISDSFLQTTNSSYSKIVTSLERAVDFATHMLSKGVIEPSIVIARVFQSGPSCLLFKDSFSKHQRPLFLPMVRRVAENWLPIAVTAMKEAMRTSVIDTHKLDGAAVLVDAVVTLLQTHQAADLSKALPLDHGDIRSTVLHYVISALDVAKGDVSKISEGTAAETLLRSLSRLSQDPGNAPTSVVRAYLVQRLFSIDKLRVRIFAARLTASWATDLMRAEEAQLVKNRASKGPGYAAVATGAAVTNAAPVAVLDDPTSVHMSVELLLSAAEVASDAHAASERVVDLAMGSDSLPGTSCASLAHWLSAESGLDFLGQLMTGRLHSSIMKESGPIVALLARTGRFAHAEVRAVWERTLYSSASEGGNLRRLLVGVAENGPPKLALWMFSYVLAQAETHFSDVVSLVLELASLSFKRSELSDELPESRVGGSAVDGEGPTAAAAAAGGDAATFAEPEVPEEAAEVKAEEESHVAEVDGIQFDPTKSVDAGLDDFLWAVLSHPNAPELPVMPLSADPLGGSGRGDATCMSAVKEATAQGSFTYELVPASTGGGANKSSTSLADVATDTVSGMAREDEVQRQLETVCERLIARARGYPVVKRADRKSRATDESAVCINAVLGVAMRAVRLLQRVTYSHVAALIESGHATTHATLVSLTRKSILSRRLDLQNAARRAKGLALLRADGVCAHALAVVAGLEDLYDTDTYSMQSLSSCVEAMAVVEGGILDDDEVCSLIGERPPPTLPKAADPSAHRARLEAAVWGKRDPVLRALGVLQRVVVELQARDFSFESTDVHPWYSCRGEAAGVLEALDDRFGVAERAARISVSTAVLLECAAYAAGVMRPTLRSLRGRFATLVVLHRFLRGDGHTRGRQFVSDIGDVVWCDACERTAEGRLAAFEFFFVAAGGVSYMARYLCDVDVRKRRVGFLLFGGGDDREDATHNPESYGETPLPLKHLSYFSSLMRAQNPTFSTSPTFMCLSKDTAQRTLSLVFGKGTASKTERRRQLQPHELGAMGMRALLMLFLASNSSTTSVGEGLTRQPPRITDLLIVGPDATADDTFAASVESALMGARDAYNLAGARAVELPEPPAGALRAPPGSIIICQDMFSYTKPSALVGLDELWKFATRASHDVATLAGDWFMQCRRIALSSPTYGTRSSSDSRSVLDEILVEFRRAAAVVTASGDADSSVSRAESRRILARTSDLVELYLRSLPGASKVESHSARVGSGAEAMTALLGASGKGADADDDDLPASEELEPQSLTRLSSVEAGTVGSLSTSWADAPSGSVPDVDTGWVVLLRPRLSDMLRSAPTPRFTEEDYTAIFRALTGQSDDERVSAASADDPFTVVPAALQRRLWRLLMQLPTSPAFLSAMSAPESVDWAQLYGQGGWRTLYSLQAAAGSLGEDIQDEELRMLAEEWAASFVENKGLSGAIQQLLLSEELSGEDLSGGGPVHRAVFSAESATEDQALETTTARADSFRTLRPLETQFIGSALLARRLRRAVAAAAVRVLLRTVSRLGDRFDPAVLTESSWDSASSEDDTSRLHRLHRLVCRLLSFLAEVGVESLAETDKGSSVRETTAAASQATTDALMTLRLVARAALKLQGEDAPSSAQELEWLATALFSISPRRTAVMLNRIAFLSPLAPLRAAVLTDMIGPMLRHTEVARNALSPLMVETLVRLPASFAGGTPIMCALTFPGGDSVVLAQRLVMMMLRWHREQCTGETSGMPGQASHMNNGGADRDAEELSLEAAPVPEEPKEEIGTDAATSDETLEASGTSAATAAEASASGSAGKDASAEKSAPAGGDAAPPAAAPEATEEEEEDEEARTAALIAGVATRPMVVACLEAIAAMLTPERRSGAPSSDLSDVVIVDQQDTQEAAAAAMAVRSVLSRSPEKDEGRDAPAVEASAPAAAFSAVVDALSSLEGEPAPHGSTVRDMLMDFLFQIGLFVPVSEGDGGRLVRPLCRSADERRAAYKLLQALLERTIQDDAPGRPEDALEWTQRLLRRLRCLTSGGGSLLDPDDLWDYSPTGTLKSSTGYLGLINPSCTCYINSVLQQLFTIAPIRNAVLASDTLTIAPRGVASEAELKASREAELARLVHVEDDKEKSKAIEAAMDVQDAFLHEHRMLFELQRAFLWMKQSELRAFNPSDLIQHMRILGFKNIKAQNDATELLQRLLARVEVALGASQEGLRIKEEVAGQVAQYVDRRSCCKQRTQKVDDFYALELPTGPQFPTLHLALKHWARAEWIDDYNCDMCGRKGVSVAKTHRLCRLPHTLMLLLNRNDYDPTTDSQRKVNDRLAFPDKLDMTPYTDWGDEEATPDMFELTGVVIHRGTHQNGHYFSLINAPIISHRAMSRAADPEGRSSSVTTSSAAAATVVEGVRRQWMCFDDSSVRPISADDIPGMAFGGTRKRVVKTATSHWSWHRSTKREVEEVQDQNAVLLIYTRKGTPSPGGAERDVAFAKHIAEHASSSDEASRAAKLEQQLRKAVEARSSTGLRVLPRSPEAMEEEELGACVPPSYKLVSSQELLSEEAVEIRKTNTDSTVVSNRFDPALAAFLGAAAGRVPKAIQPTTSRIAVSFVFDTLLRSRAMDGPDTQALVSSLHDVMQAGDATAIDVSRYLLRSALQVPHGPTTTTSESDIEGGILEEPLEPIPSKEVLLAEAVASVAAAGGYTGPRIERMTIVRERATVRGAFATFALVTKGQFFAAHRVHEWTRTLYRRQANHFALQQAAMGDNPDALLEVLASSAIDSPTAEAAHACSIEELATMVSDEARQVLDSLEPVERSDGVDWIPPGFGAAMAANKVGFDRLWLTQVLTKNSHRGPRQRFADLLAAAVKRASEDEEELQLVREDLAGWGLSAMVDQLRYDLGQEVDKAVRRSQLLKDELRHAIAEAAKPPPPKNSAEATDARPATPPPPMTTASHPLGMASLKQCEESIAMAEECLREVSKLRFELDIQEEELLQQLATEAKGEDVKVLNERVDHSVAISDLGRALYESEMTAWKHSQKDAPVTQMEKELVLVLAISKGAKRVFEGESEEGIDPRKDSAAAAPASAEGPAPAAPEEEPKAAQTYGQVKAIAQVEASLKEAQALAAALQAAMDVFAGASESLSRLNQMPSSLLGCVVNSMLRIVRSTSSMATIHHHWSQIFDVVAALIDTRLPAGAAPLTWPPPEADSLCRILVAEAATVKTLVHRSELLLRVPDTTFAFEDEDEDEPAPSAIETYPTLRRNTVIAKLLGVAHAALPSEPPQSLHDAASCLGLRFHSGSLDYKAWVETNRALSESSSSPGSAMLIGGGFMSLLCLLWTRERSSRPLGLGTMDSLDFTRVGESLRALAKHLAFAPSLALATAHVDVKHPFAWVTHLMQTSASRSLSGMPMLPFGVDIETELLLYFTRYARARVSLKADMPVGDAYDVPYFFHTRLEEADEESWSFSLGDASAAPRVASPYSVASTETTHVDLPAQSTTFDGLPRDDDQDSTGAVFNEPGSLLRFDEGVVAEELPTDSKDAEQNDGDVHPVTNDGDVHPVTNDGDVHPVTNDVGDSLALAVSLDLSQASDAEKCDPFFEVELARQDLRSSATDPLSEAFPVPFLHFACVTVREFRTQFSGYGLALAKWVHRVEEIERGLQLPALRTLMMPATRKPWTVRTGAGLLDVAQFQLPTGMPDFVYQDREGKLDVASLAFARGMDLMQASAAAETFGYILSSDLQATQFSASRLSEIKVPEAMEDRITEADDGAMFLNWLRIAISRPGVDWWGKLFAVQAPLALDASWFQGIEHFDAEVFRPSRGLAMPAIATSSFDSSLARHAIGSEGLRSRCAFVAEACLLLRARSFLAEELLAYAHFSAALPSSVATDAAAAGTEPCELEQFLHRIEHLRSLFDPCETDHLTLLTEHCQALAWRAKRLPDTECEVPTGLRCLLRPVLDRPEDLPSIAAKRLLLAGEHTEPFEGLWWSEKYPDVAESVGAGAGSESSGLPVGWFTTWEDGEAENEAAGFLKGLPPLRRGYVRRPLRKDAVSVWIKDAGYPAAQGIYVDHGYEGSSKSLTFSRRVGPKQFCLWSKGSTELVWHIGVPGLRSVRGNRTAVFYKTDSTSHARHPPWDKFCWGWLAAEDPKMYYLRAVRGTGSKVLQYIDKSVRRVQSCVVHRTMDPSSPEAMACQLPQVQPLSNDDLIAERVIAAGAARAQWHEALVALRKESAAIRAEALRARRQRVLGAKNDLQSGGEDLDAAAGDAGETGFYPPRRGVRRPRSDGVDEGSKPNRRGGRANTPRRARAPPEDTRGHNGNLDMLHEYDGDDDTPTLNPAPIGPNPPPLTGAGDPADAADRIKMLRELTGRDEATIRTILISTRWNADEAAARLLGM
jgi:hypothetical protein